MIKSTDVSQNIDLKSLADKALMWIEENPSKALALGVVGLFTLKNRSIRKLATFVVTTWGASYVTHFLEKENN